MKGIVIAAAIGLGLMASAGTALADPGKDESGKGRERGGYSRFDGDHRGRGGGGGARDLRFDQGEFGGRRSRHDA